MKKIIAILLTILLYINIVAISEEISVVEYKTEWNEYYLPEKQISVIIPADYDAITQDVSETNHFDKDTVKMMKEAMIRDGICLDALVPDITREINVSVNDNVLESLGIFSEDTVNTLLPEIEKGFGNAKITKNEIVSEENILYFKVWATFGTGNNTYYGLKYGTIIDYQAIWISIYAFDGQLTKEDEYIIDQIWKGSELIKHEYPGENNSNKVISDKNQFIDPESGFSFAIPEGWVEVPLKNERQYMKIKIAPDGNLGAAMIGYVLVDKFAELPNSVKKDLGVVERKQLDKYFSESMIKIDLGDALTSIVEKKQNGVEYYVGKIKQNYNIGEDSVQFEIEGSAGFFFKNGYLAIVYFYDLSNTNKYQEAFEMVLNSFSFVN